MPVLRSRDAHPIRRLGTTGVALVVSASALLIAGPDPASAAVTPLHGYRATVLGFTSWYGSYGMTGIGTAWCIDHGSHAPDPAFAYRPADLTTSVPASTRTAMAWVLGRHGSGSDRARHAAVMLVMHDLMGARYPYGGLDVERLTVRDLAGFAGQEAKVVELARAFKADGLRHAHLRGPLAVRIRVSEPDGDGTAAIAVSLHDGSGRPVSGVPVTLEVSSGSSVAARSLTIGGDGTAHTVARPVRLPLTVRANAVVPDLALDAWAPTTRSAQRVARPAVRALTAEATVSPPAPTTTTTTIAPTTTTIPPTTTTVAPTTTTAPPPTTTTSTTLAPTTTLAAVAPPPTTTTSTPPPTVLSAPPALPSLPRTGVDAAGLVLLASGLVLLGAAALEARRQRIGAPAAIGHHGGDGGIRPR